MVIDFKTNNRPFENSYKVFDTAGNVMFERDFDDSNTTHTDLINLPQGCYELVVYDTGGDGMNNWPSNHGNGIHPFKKLERLNDRTYLRAMVWRDYKVWL